MSPPQEAPLDPAESCAVVVYGTESSVEAAAAALPATGWAVAARAHEPRRLAELVGARASVVLLDEAQLPLLRRSWRGRAAGETPALLVLAGASGLLERSPGIAGRPPLEQVLVWPSEASALGDRLRALAGALVAQRRLRAIEQGMALLVELVDPARAGESDPRALQRRLQQVALCMRAEEARLLSFDQARGTCRLLGSSAESGAPGPSPRVAISPEGRAALASGEEVVAGPIDLGPRLARRDGQLKLAEMGHVLVVPLRAGGGAPAALEVLFVGRTTPTAAAREFARLVAAVLAPGPVGRGVLGAGREPASPRATAGAGEGGRPSLRWQRELVDDLADGGVLLDADGRVLHVNAPVEGMVGQGVVALAARPFVELVDPDDQAALRAQLDELRVGRQPGRIDLRLRTTHQGRRVVSVSFAALTAVEPPVLLLSLRDVTEERALAEELLQVKRFFEQLIDASPEAIVASDGAGTVTLFNKAAEAIFGCPAQQVTGRVPFDQLLPEGVGAKLREQLLTRRGQGVAFDPVRNEILDAQGKRVPVQISLNVMPGAASAQGLVAVISDLRERLRIEHDLVHVRERLLASEKQALLAELAGTTAHELNQPLTSVMGYAELLLRRLAPEDVNHHAAETILEQAQRMADIVRKIGKITRYETKTYLGETQILDLDRSTE